jgi:Flp pilus assembly protein CpaB
MKPKTTILLILAVGCGLAAAFFTNKLIAERNKPVEEVEKVPVLVAKAGIKKIPAMTFIRKVDDFFEVQEKSKADVPKNILSDLTDKDLKDGFRVARSISEGNFLTRDDVISRDLEGLAAKVPPGMRAMAFRVTADTVAGGFVLPNSKVDVVWTFRTTNNESGTLTILQDMLVLAVDTQATRNPDSPQTILGATVTLAVKPEDAQRLALATNNGELRLALRPVGDDKKLLLHGSRPIDLAKIFSDLGEGKTEDTGDSTASTPPPVVPTLPALPRDTKDPVTPPAKDPMIAAKDPPDVPPAKRVRIHKLRIEDGGNIRTIDYVYDEEAKSYEGAIKRTDIDSKP